MQRWLRAHEHTKDTDLVPSDIAAGLALLHQEQDKMEHCRNSDDVIPHSPSSPIVSLLLCHWIKLRD
ncbi:hypothetical protein AOLI_G00036850 [Acnodon oligacanthus]